MNLTNFTVFTTTDEMTTKHIIRNGYDIPPVGLASGHFASIHISALTCISISFVCAMTVIIVQFTSNKTAFYRWTTGERFAVYLAMSDAFFNIVHSLDHAHMLILMNHVSPPVLCKIYGGFLAYSMHVQLLTVMAIAVNVVWSVRLNKKPDFGQNDRNLYIIVLTIPLVIMIIGHSANIYGPIGAFCFTDASLKLAFLFLLTVPVTIVCVSATAMYIISWKYIRDKTMKVSSTYKESPSTRAARNMSLFVLSFLLQWHQSAIFGIYAAIAPPPLPFHYLETSLTNLGGLFNLCVYIIIIRRKRMSSVAKTSSGLHSHTPTNTRDETAMTKTSTPKHSYHDKNESNIISIS